MRFAQRNSCKHSDPPHSRNSVLCKLCSIERHKKVSIVCLNNALENAAKVRRAWTRNNEQKLLREKDEAAAEAASFLL